MGTGFSSSHQGAEDFAGFRTGPGAQSLQAIETSWKVNSPLRHYIDPWIIKAELTSRAICRYLGQHHGL
jgi:hypothetical protein